MDARRQAVLAGSFLALAAFAAFFLIRPFFDAAPAYRPRPPGTTYAYSFLVVVAFLPYATALWASGQKIPLSWAIAGTLVLHGLVLPAAFSQSQDFYAYLFYGKMWAVHGANPYVDLPLRFAADPWFPWHRWPAEPSVYGPAWTLAMGAVARLSPNSLGTAIAWAKLLVAALGAATVTGLVRAARIRGIHPGHALLLMAWNPLVVVSLPLGGHADVAITAAWAWAMVADRRRPVVATLLLAVATLVKAYAAVVLVAYLVALAGRSPRLALRSGLAALAAAFLWAPFWRGAATFSGVLGIAERASASLGGTVQLGLGAFLPDPAAVWVVRGVGLAVVVTVVVVVSRRRDFVEDPWPGAAAAFAAYLAVTPWFLPWHLVGLLVLTAVAASPPLRAAAYSFSGTSMLTLGFGGVWWGRVVQTTARYGLPAMFWIRGHLADAQSGRSPTGSTSPRS